MPHKYPQEKGWNVPRQKYKLKNWSQYSNSLKNRGRIDLWLDKEAIDNWYEEGQWTEKSRQNFIDFVSYY